MRAGKILLLLAILVGGGAIEIAWHARAHGAIGPTGWRVLSGRFHGPSHRFESEQRRELGERRRIRIENDFGAVRVTGGPAGEVSAVLRTRVYLPVEEEARRFSDRVRLEWRELPGQLALATNREALSHGGEQDVGFETDLELIVPTDAEIEIENRHGAVSVADVAALQASTSNQALRAERVSGAVKLTNRSGSLTALEIAGPLSFSTRHGSVELVDVAGAVVGQAHHGDVRVERLGSLKLELRHGDLEAEQLSGTLELRGSHAGASATGVGGDVEIETSDRAVRLEQVEGDAQVRARHAALDVERVTGALSAEISNADVRVAGVTGPVKLNVRRGAVRGRDLAGGVRIETSGPEVSLAAFAGPVWVHSQRGDVTLEPERALDQPLEVSCERGSIHLSLPGHGPLELEASSERGRVAVDVPGFETSLTSRQRVNGRLGDGGPRVSLRSSRGDVTVIADDSETR